MLFRILIAIGILTISTYSQEINITPQLKLIEKGEISDARDQLAQLLKSNPEDPSVKFLHGVLTEDGSQAVKVFEEVYNEHPNSNYADAALYRLFSFSYSLGAYNKAEEYKTNLLDEYPGSPYIKAVNRKLPDQSIYAEDSEPTKDISKVEQKSETSSPNFTIQAGAFLNVENARNLNEKFIAKGYYSKIFPKEIGGSILNVVTVGQFKERTEAEKFILKIKDDYNLNGRIISFN